MLKKLSAQETMGKYGPSYLPLLRVGLREMKIICYKYAFCFDISDIAPALGNNYYDSVHHNSNGNFIIANQIYDINWG